MVGLLHDSLPFRILIQEVVGLESMISSTWGEFNTAIIHAQESAPSTSLI